LLHTYISCKIEDDFWEFFNYVEDVDGFLPVPRILLRDNSNPFERYTNSELIQRIRFSRDTIETTVLPMVYHNIRDGDNRGLPVPPALKLYVALRFFATGSYQQVYADVATISQSSVCRIVREISEELARSLPRLIKFPAHTEILKRQFFEIAGFPR
ncbi:putative nuclease HARBI1, partial [Anoplophora glabripennis]|uniref:putative nuclease HARBI1 n=1 Tax=Anoplophora glabripennis TaxID=217634 RepID=UPI000C778C4D